MIKQILIALTISTYCSAGMISQKEVTTNSSLTTDVVLDTAQNKKNDYNDILNEVLSKSKRNYLEHNESSLYYVFDITNSKNNPLVINNSIQSAHVYVYLPKKSSELTVTFYGDNNFKLSELAFNSGGKSLINLWKDGSYFSEVSIRRMELHGKHISGTIEYSPEINVPVPPAFYILSMSLFLFASVQYVKRTVNFIVKYCAILV
jgi:hypothetical protein